MPFVRLKPKGSTSSMVTKGRRVLPLKSRQSEAGVRRRAFAPPVQKGNGDEVSWRQGRSRRRYFSRPHAVSGHKPSASSSENARGRRSL